MANNVQVQKLNFQEIVVVPNLISLFRILAATVIFIAAITHKAGLWVALLYLAAVLSDKLDGTIARFFNKETKLGEKL
jgi:CDP-diacylglycerol--glycerol-3-phosphate 3-phosphatidyltransferase